MDWLTILFGISTIVLGGLSAWYQRQSNHLQSHIIALQDAVEEIKRFDEATAKNFLAQARMLDHESWWTGELFKKYIRKVQPLDDNAEELGVEIAANIGGVHKMALANFRTMVRVYQLSGNPITPQLVERWVQEEFIPSHYKAFMLSQV